jgi:prefoldin alpha subunit
MGEAEFRTAVAALDTGRAQLESLARQEELVRLSLEEYARARETMLNFRGAGRGAEILIPIGANSFLFGAIGDTERCIVGLGSDVALEDTIPKALERLESRIKQAAQVQQAVAQRIEELEERVAEYQLQAQREYERLQREGRGGAGETR